MTVSITVAGGSIQVGRARSAVKGNFRGGAAGMGIGILRVADYDVSHDGQHFVMFPLDVKSVGRTEHLTYVLNWFTELRGLLPKN